MAIRSVLLLAPLCLLHLVACGPTLVFPGGALDGKAADAPDDWTFTDETSTVQLETNPGDPYSVNIWATGVGDKLYVHAGTNRATWVENMEADPSVRVRIEGNLYSLSATRVDSQAEFDVFADAYETKYGSRPRNEDVSEAYLYGLTPR